MNSSSITAQKLTKVYRNAGFRVEHAPYSGGLHVYIPNRQLSRCEVEVVAEKTFGTVAMRPDQFRPFGQGFIIAP